ncbi:MAG: hypothetical protein JRJ47_13815 [Deltaproteobacteria bacterium]|nr:hypothetical protein [Deltaproteobacteria bacterium]
MIWFLFVIALVYIMFGTLLLFATGLTREQYIPKFRIGDPRKLGPLPLVAGILFLLAASSSSQPTFIIVLGLLALVKGLIFLFGPREKVIRMMEWWLEGSDNKFKVWAVIAIGLGIAILVTIVQ